MKLPPLLLLFAWLACTPAFGQRLSGIVLDAKTSEPLAGANVLTLLGDGVITDAKGHFVIEKPQPIEVLTISFIGYEPLVTDTIRFQSIEEISLNLKLTPKLSGLGEVVVSAGRYEQRLEEVTVSLDVLKPQIQQDKNLVKLENTLQQAPGVNVTDGQANIRGGSGWTYGTGTRVQTLVDNMPLISGDASQAQWDLVPIHSIERVEVLKGASSVLYGSAAMNGIINTLTHPFPEKQSLLVNLYTELYDAPKRESLKWWNGTRSNTGLNFDYQQPLTENTGLLLSGGQIYDDGFRYLEEEKRTRLFSKFFYQNKKLLNLEASLAANVNYSAEGDALLWQNDSLAYIPSDSSITLTSGWDFYIDPTVSIRHGRMRHTLQGRYLKLNNNAKNDQADYTNSSDQLYAQYLFQYFLSDKLALTAGASSSHTHSESVVFVGEHNSHNNAVFLQGDFKPWAWLTLNAGVRYEDFYLDDRYTKKPVFRGGINAQIVKGTNARFSYGEAFRFPAISETYTSTSLGAIIVYPNPDLKPETGHSYELGLRQMFYSKKIKGYVDLAAFQMQYYDMIEYTFAFWGPTAPPSFGLGFTPLNVGETLIRGVELAAAFDGELSPKVKYRVLAGYTYTLPEAVNPEKVIGTDYFDNELTYQKSSSDSSSNILKYRYQHLAKIDFQLEAGNWHGGFSVRYNDFMENIDSFFETNIPGVKENRERNLNGDLVVDARLGYQFTKRWQADLIVSNLFNREVMIRPAYLGPPRTFTVRVSYSL